MKICLLCDIHLSYNKHTVQYDAFEWACEDIRRKKPDIVAVPGDFTSDGGIFAAKRFIKRIHSLNIPAVVIPGNSDCRTAKNISYMNELASPCVNRFDGLTVFAVNDAQKTVSDDAFACLDKAGEKDVIIMHHPVKVLKEPSRSRFAEWRSSHPEPFLFYAHLHESVRNGRDYGLQALDPDKASGENPCITYFDTETQELEKIYYYCPVPNDLWRYVGISCFRPEKDLAYAAEHRLHCIELRPGALAYDRDTLSKLVADWRAAGGSNLSLHAPEVTYSDGAILETDTWDRFVELAMMLNADRVTLHVPAASLDSVRKNPEVLDTVADFLAKRFAMLPNKCVVGVENMHMTEKERPDGSRRFGYLPEECVEFMKRLQEKCPREIGINLDVGHARNNAPYSAKCPCGTWYAELGRYAVGYHLHQVTEKPEGGYSNHMPFDGFYGKLVSLASFFRSWNLGMLEKAPVIFEIRDDGAYEPVIRLLERQNERRVSDLHTHTWFSDCGRDRPEKIITAAIENGVKLLGISDHSYGVGERRMQYLKKIRDLAPRYADRVKLMCGIEIPTKPGLFDVENPDDILGYDYALIEHITDHDSIVGGDLIGFCKNLGIRCGVAHTDLFAYCEKYGYEPRVYFERMAKAGIFWEMNVCDDSVHFFRKHAYVAEFMNSEAKQSVVRDAGLSVSIGSDCHRCDEYPGYRVQNMYDFLTEKNIRLADAYFG